MSKHITVEKRGALLLVGINRVDKRNAFDVSMFEAIGRAYGQLEHDDFIF
jgi:enoyl-CoA hydratase/carnithine racemase